VFNANGEVIGVNFAYVAGFSGATLGVSVESLRPLLEEAPKKTLRTPSTGISHEARGEQ
jgi:hypothetical protein